MLVFDKPSRWWVGIGSFLLLATLATPGQAQWLHTAGHHIVDEAGEPVILRGIGLGGWMLQEGYMLRTHGAQHELEERMVHLMGAEAKEEFYTAWLDNHCRREDIDSMAAWGYNSVRLAMHYKLFTPPLQDEPVPGQITWRDEGFARVDSLLAWVKANNMWLILDMHAAPGGQGENADISDYDRDYPSLWESEANQDKLVALWYMLAERYADEPYIAAYDLINETNWGFQNHASDLNGCAESSNTLLWDLQRRITDTIRRVDTRHMIVLEGNCWGNNYSGLSSLWDDNMVVSYHKYWNANGQGDMQAYMDSRNKYNAPIWLGETGENSNTWFTDAISRLEENGIGWSMWPLKKMGGNNPMEIEINSGYQRILDYWHNSGPQPSQEEAYATLMQIAENLKLENNTMHPDVVDAMIRQPHTRATLPWAQVSIAAEGETLLYCSDYDLGIHTEAYEDEDYTNESGQPGGARWNLGGGYRNDGVDMEACADAVSNGFNVGWTENGEWMQYTVDVEASGVYDISVRYALQSGTSTLRLTSEGIQLTDLLDLEVTGGYQTWATATWQGVALHAGTQALRLHIVDGGANLNYITVTRMGELSALPFRAVGGATNTAGDTVFLHLNKRLAEGTPAADEFTLTLDGEPLPFGAVGIAPDHAQKLYFTIDALFDNHAEILVSYSGTGLIAEDGTGLASFTDVAVTNQRPFFYLPPVRIEAEAFAHNEGFGTEVTTDIGGGINMGYTDWGDYMEYDLSVREPGFYDIKWRVASPDTDSRVRLEQRSLDGAVLHSAVFTLPTTGGWQTWTSFEGGEMELSEGITKLRLVVERARFNLNWFELTFNRVTGIAEPPTPWVRLYPNPVGAGQPITLRTAPDPAEPFSLTLTDARGKSYFYQQITSREVVQVYLPALLPGMYYITLVGNGTFQVLPLMIEH